MSTKILTNYDFTHLELYNVRFQQLASAPSSPAEGWTYWDTTLHQLGLYNANSSSWNYLGSGGGTVTSITVTVPSFLSVSPATITTSGTFAITLANQTGNVVFASPSGGGSGAPTFRSLVAADIPSLDTSILTTGLLPIARGGTNSNATPTNGGVGYGTGTAHAYTAAGSTGQILQSAGAASPTWSTATYPSTGGTTGTILRSNGTNFVNSTSTFADTYAVSTILYASSANTVAGLATANNAVLVTNGSGVPSLSTTLPTNISVNGLKYIVSAAVSAAGSTQGTATALTSDENVVTTVASNTGVVLPASTAGIVITVVNKGANPLNVYPPVSSAIDAAGTNTAVVIPVGGFVTFDCVSGTQWYSSLNTTVTGMGTVTSVSVVSANGFGGSVATVTTTPAITITTSVTGILKGNGTSVTAAVASDIPTPLTTKGDIFAYSSSASRLPVGGSNKMVLEVNSGATFGIDWVSMDHTFISDFDTQVRTSRLDQMAAPTASVSMNSQKITNLLDPTGPQDAATKNYVDINVQGFQQKPAPRAATTAALATNTYANGASGVGATLTANSNGVMAAVDGINLGHALNAVTITNVTNASTTVTATIASTVGLAIGQAIQIVGITGFTTNNPNGDFVVNTVPSGTTFTYIVPNAPTGSYSSGGTVTATADVVLVKNEAAAANNGLYTVTQQGSASLPYILTRHVDMDQTGEFTGAFFIVESGTTNGGSMWVCTNIGPIVIGTNSITFTELNKAADISATAPIVITGNVININQGNGITNSGGNLIVDTAVVVRKFASTIGDGSTTAIVVTHNLGTKDITASVRDAGSDVHVHCDITSTSTNTATFTFAVAPTTNQYRVTVHG